MFKNRPTAVIAVVGIIAFLIMVLAMIVASQSGGNAAQPTAAASDSAEAGAAFFAANAQAPDVQVTESGLQYKVVTEGDGASPTASSTVTVNYEGRLIDGTVFDSGESITFALNRVIAGWTEGMQLMNVGSTYTFYIPPELGYGADGYPGVIPPNAMLIFDVTLLSVQ